MSRFDYVMYDKQAQREQGSAKSKCEDLERFINEGISSANGASNRYRSLALTKLEEVYMWIGKAIRDEQIDRNGSAKLQEERNNS